MALVARSLRKCLEQLQRGNAGGRRGKPAGKPRTESTRTLCHGRREGRECTKTLKHGVPIRRVAQAAPRASTGLTWTHGPFRMRNLSHKDEWHSWVITHTKKKSCYHQPEKFPGSPHCFASQATFPVLHCPAAAEGLMAETKRRCHAVLKRDMTPG